MERSVREEARLRAGEILPPDRLERGDAGSSALRDMQGRSANLGMQGDPGRSTRACSSRSRLFWNGHPGTRIAGAWQTRFDVSATPRQMCFEGGSAETVTGCQGNAVDDETG